MTTNITVTNLKGGVGKTTTAGLMALFLTEHRKDPVVLIDMDPQCGSTSLFLGAHDPHQLSIKDALVAALEGVEPFEIMQDALINVPGKSNLFLIPSDKRLTDLGSGIPANLLLNVIQSAELSDETTVIIDTGTAQGVVSMGICAADMVLIPMTLSKQTIKPTMNTLSLTTQFHKPLLGILPTVCGEAKWESKYLDYWQTTLDETPRLKHLSGVILPRMPYSKFLIRGAWAKMPFPENFEPIFDVIYTRAFGKNTLPTLRILKTLEVSNG